MRRSRAALSRALALCSSPATRDVLRSAYEAVQWPGESVSLADASADLSTPERESLLRAIRSLGNVGIVVRIPGLDSSPQSRAPKKDA